MMSTTRISRLSSSRGAVQARPATARNAGQFAGPSFVRGAARGYAVPAALVAERVVEARNTDDAASVSMTLAHLARLAAEGKLDMPVQTENIVWNSRKMASNLVLPIIQGKHTPPIMLESSEHGRLRVLSGNPRLSSLLAFMSGSSDVGGQHWPSAPVELDARDSAHPRWNGKTFQQLPQDAQQRVAEYPVTCLIVKPKSAA